MKRAVFEYSILWLLKMVRAHQSAKRYQWSMKQTFYSKARYHFQSNFEQLFTKCFFYIVCKYVTRCMRLSYSSVGRLNLSSQIDIINRKHFKLLLVILTGPKLNSLLFWTQQKPHHKNFILALRKSKNLFKIRIQFHAFYWKKWILLLRSPYRESVKDTACNSFY